MNAIRCIPGLWLVLWIVSTAPALAHPGSGIVIDRQGRIFFIDTGAGVWMIDRDGRLVRQQGEAFHWLAIDHRNAFRAGDLPRGMGGELPIVGSDPTLILSSDFPVAVGPDGAFYYPQPQNQSVRIMRFIPGGKPVTFATLPPVLEADADGKSRPVPWIHGLAAAPDGSLYYTEQNAVRKIAKDGTVSLVAGNITVPGCTRPPALNDDHIGSGLRGLDVKSDGTIYVAASGCGAILKIAPNGQTSVALRTEASWSPTAVAVSGDDLLILEYWFVKAEDRKAWTPRVRRLSPDGKAVVLAQVKR